MVDDEDGEADLRERWHVLLGETGSLERRGVVSQRCMPSAAGNEHDSDTVGALRVMHVHEHRETAAHGIDDVLVYPCCHQRNGQRDRECNAKEHDESEFTVHSAPDLAASNRECQG